jgi:hypothetical protein
MNKLLERSYLKLLGIGVVAVSVALAGCTAEITPVAATLEDRQEQITLRLQVTSSDLVKLMKPGLVIYLGLGDCRDRAGKIFSQAFLDGSPLVNTSRTTPKEIQETATLTADFDDRKVLDYGCAFVKGTSMSGNGAVSGPVRVKDIRSQDR